MAAVGDPLACRDPGRVSDLSALVGKALTDPTFCDQLIADPESTLRDHGVDPTDALVTTIRDLDADAIRRLAAAFDHEQAAG